MSTVSASPDDVAAVAHCKQSYDRIRSELSKVIVGQDWVIEQVLIAIFSRGHALLEGVPGLAKTLLVSSLAEATHLSFKRIQFTPDLMPSDVTGTEIIQEDDGHAPAAIQVSPRSDLRQHDPGRRDQPHAAQDPGGDAGGDAGAAGQRRRQGPQAARPLLRAGHAEPPGAGRHLPAAGSPVGPLPLVHQGGIPQRGRGMGNRPPRDHRPARPDRAFDVGRGDPRHARSW